jgi:glutathione S-transferase
VYDAARALWGSELSPFSLKARALLDWAELPYQWLPADGSRRQNLAAAWRIERAKRRRTAVRFPRTTDLDEYPLVPFLIDDGTVYYDSSAIARWIDARHRPQAGPLVPDEPAAGFAAALVDEAFDELGLYVVHHLRWVVSARTNDAGVRLAREMRRHAPPGARRGIAWWFPRRQVRRLPYLFSVAARGRPDGALPAALRPPARTGFPPTHALLEEVWARWIDAVDGILRARPFLLGDRFTLADASVYGALGMNLDDPTADRRMQTRAPATHAWLGRIRQRAHVGSRGGVGLHADLGPLLRGLRETFVPLMIQNERAFEDARRRGETRFNEAAFDAGRSLYDGTLLGRPFRAVPKTFQVQIWRELGDAWAQLDEASRARVAALAGGPPLEPIEAAGTPR